jgi:hypothetical protein
MQAVMPARFISLDRKMTSLVTTAELVMDRFPQCSISGLICADI